VKEVLIDTGPLVAVINRRDHYHDWATEQLRQLPSPLITCEPVLTESWFLLGRTNCGREMMLQWIERGLLRVDFSLQNSQARVIELMRQYQSVPMSLADACLVCLSEQRPNSTVMTLDSDFQIYRRFNRLEIPVISP
jgi:predicted nucleic acid-binding protein